MPDPTAPIPFVDVLLTWTPGGPGPTAILRRLETGAWDELARVEGSEYQVRGLHPVRVHRFAAAPVLEDGGLAPEGDWRIIRVAPLAEAAPPLPAAPTGFALAQDGPVLHAAWAPPADGVTHSLELREGATWEDGRLVARDLMGVGFSFPWWASGERTYHLKALDRLARYCRVPASITLTVAPLDDHVDANEWDHSAGGAFAGTKTNVEVVDDVLQLAAIPRKLGARTFPFGSLAGVPVFARYQPEGTYLTGTEDLGQVEDARFELDLGAGQPIDPLPFGAIHRPVLGSRRDRDGNLVVPGRRGFWARNSWRLTPIPPVDVSVEIDTAEALPGGWTGFRPYVPGTYRCRYVRFKFTLRGDGLRYLAIPTLVLRHRRKNKKGEGIENIVADPGPTTITFTTPFVLAPVVRAWVVGAEDLYDVVVSSITASGCTCQVIDRTTGLEVFPAGTIAFHALGP